jgi:hypothetical protein
MQVTMRQVEIQSRMFEVRMAHQKLNGSQIGSRFHQVGGETVAPIPAPE